MACFTIAVGFLRVADRAVDPALCIVIAQVLFVAGVVLSLWSAFLVPYLMFTHHELVPERAYGNWLLPVVPPIVASVPAAMVPTMWIVVGPLGQSVAGIIALGTVSASVWPELGHGLFVAGVAFGLLVWGFGVYWLMMALAVTIRAARKHLPFSLGWWAFTFPVGTLTSGSYGLYAATHAAVFSVAGLLLLVLLATTWSLVAMRSLRSIAATMRVAQVSSSRLAAV